MGGIRGYSAKKRSAAKGRITTLCHVLRVTGRRFDREQVKLFFVRVGLAAHAYILPFMTRQNIRIRYRPDIIIIGDKRLPIRAGLASECYRFVGILWRLGGRCGFGCLRRMLPER